MDTATLLLVGGSVLVAIVVVGGTLFGVLRLFKGMSKDSAERARLLREGIQAAGRVMGVQMGGMSMSVGAARHLQLHIQLEVQPPGRPPYAAMLTTMISELQIPQIQPGALLTLRVDRMDPNKIALEAAGAPMPQAYDYRGQPMGMPQPMMGYGMPLGAPPVVPQGAKIGLWVGVGAALIGVIVAIVVVAVNVGGRGPRERERRRRHVREGRALLRGRRGGQPERGELQEHG